MGRGGELSKKQVGLGVCCGCFAFWLILILWLASLGIVPYTKLGLRYHVVSKEIDSKVYPPGRHAIGLGYAFLEFPRNLEVINFTHPYNSEDSKAEGVDRVVRITAKDSATVDIAVTISYMLDEATLQDLYLTYAFNWKSSFTTNARSVLRDKAAQYNALDFVTDGKRIAIEKELGEAMKNDVLKTKRNADGKFTEGGASLVTFNLLNIAFANVNRNKDEEILTIVKGEIDQKKIKESEKLDLIKEITKTNITKLSANRVANLNVIEQQNLNLKKSIETNLVTVTSTTEKLLKDIDSSAVANATNYRAGTENRKILKQKALRDYEAETTKLVNAINSETTLLDAKNQEKVTAILAESSASVIKIKRNADAKVLNLKAESIKAGFSDILSVTADSQGVKYTADDLNRLVFVESLTAHNKKKIHMDTQVPENLKLGGQKEIQTANLT